MAKKQAEKAAEAERVAQLEAAKLRAFDEFLRKNLFGIQDVKQMLEPATGDPNITLGELLDRARERLADDKDKSEERTSNQLYLKLWLSRSYWNIGRFAQASSLHEELVDEMKKTIGEEHEFTLQYVVELAQLYGAQFRWCDALAMYEEVLLGRRRLLGEQDPETLNSLHNVANAFRILGLYERAAEHYQLRLELEQRNKGNNSPVAAVYAAQLARVLYRLGPTTDRDESMKQAIDHYRQQQDTVNLHATLSERGLACMQLGTWTRQSAPWPKLSISAKHLALASVNEPQQRSLMPSLA